MILHRVAVTNVGPFVGTPAAAGPFAAGLNILSAPNETGKSTLLKAAGRALFDRHTCKAPEIKNLRPAGTQFAPAVTVEFVTGAGRFRVEKTFLQGPRSLLSEWQGADEWQPVAEGDAADDRLNVLLGSTKPGRGATDAAAHWGMLGYLWMRQGEPSEWPEWGRNTAGGIVQGMLVKVEIDPFIESVRERMWAAYVDNFTPSTGQPKVGGTLLNAETLLARVEEELAKLARDRQQFEADEEAYRRAADELPRREAEHARCQEEAERLRVAITGLASLRAEAGNSRRALESAQEKFQVLRRDEETCQRLDREGQELSRQAGHAEKEAAGCRGEVERIRRELRVAEAAREENAALLAANEAAAHRAGLLVKACRLSETIARGSATLERCNAEAAVVKELAAHRAEVPVVSSAKLRRLESLSEAVCTNRARVEALGLAVELLPTVDTDLVARADDGASTVQPALRAGEPRLLHAVGSLVLDLPGWGRIRIRSGAGEARVLGETLATDEAALRKELEEIGVRDLDSVRRFVEDGRALDARLDAARQALAAALGKGETPDTLRARLAGDRRQLQMLGEETSAITTEEQSVSLSDLEGAAHHATVQSERQRQEQTRHDKALKLLRERLGEAQRTLEGAERHLLSLRLQTEGLARQAADLRARHDDNLSVVLDAAAEASYDAKVAHRRSLEKLPPDADALPERHRRALAAAEQVHGELTRQRDALGVLRGRLEFLGTQSIHTREAALQAQREDLLAQAVQARTRSRAARLVHDLLERRKQAATLAVLAPLQERLGARFAQVSGDRNRQIFLDQSLTVRGLGRKDGELVPFADLSQGAKEQLLLCLRLAIAEELAARGDGAQSLILDDVLVNTDAGRQARVLDLLHDAAGRGLQILVCTCHPDRYRGVGEVVVLRREG